MQLSLFEILNFFIFIVGFIAIIRYHKADRIFFPFFVFIWVGCINDALSYILVANGFETMINNNIYSLIEALLLVWFFAKTGLFKKFRALPFVIAFVFTAAWFAVFRIVGSIQSLFVYFRIIYGFGIVLMSVSTINGMLRFHKNSILESPLFLICTGFVAYYTLTVLIYSFWLYGITKSQHFLVNIYYIMLAVNFLTNLIYAAAMLRMQKMPIAAF